MSKGKAASECHAVDCWRSSVQADRREARTVAAKAQALTNATRAEEQSPAAAQRYRPLARP
jgi:hypothetical protein